jgi:CheY-like chemotaxis protein
MGELRVLVIEDSANWQEELPKILARLGDAIQVDVSATYTDASSKLKRFAYDLAIVDLSLDELPEENSRNEAGLDLLRLIRTEQKKCGTIVLSENANVENTQIALREHKAHFVLQKLKFEAKILLEHARDAIRIARLELSKVQNQNRYQLSMSLGKDYLIETQLRGPGCRSAYHCPEHITFEAEDLGHRADNLNVLRSSGNLNHWRRELNMVGRAIARVLEQDPRVFGELQSARALAKQRSNLWLEFSGPAATLGLPFELLLESNDYLVTSHVMTRRVEAPMSRKPEHFHTFIEQLVDADAQLRVLLVCANVDGSIPAVEAEVEVIKTILHAELEQLHIKHDIEILKEPDYNTLLHRLREGKYHLFHFAGHGRFNDQVPETNGFVLANGAGIRTLDANTIELRLRDTELRMVYASCCFGARTTPQPGIGIFQGVFHALAQADVPYSLGYRWAVGDDSALAMAETFYSALWQTFSPGDALLQARTHLVESEYGRNDDTWASAVLQAQPY